MKTLILSAFLFSSVGIQAKEYRYHLMATTGPQEEVCDSKGVKTTISWAKGSNKEARFVLSKILELGGVSGTVKNTKWYGVDYNQHISLEGDLSKEVFTTSTVPNGAAPEKYQKLNLKHLKVYFPLSRHRTGKHFDTGYLEVHFSFETLFPDGIVFNGKKVDLTRYEVKPSSK